MQNIKPTIENITIKKTNLNLEGLKYSLTGKVRDIYSVPPYIILIASDRISAFDRILPRPIPYKGQILNQIANYFLNQTNHICPNWKINVPHPNVTIGLECKPIKLEMVIRRYLTGHAWREYKLGKRTLSGAPLPDGLKENDKLPYAIVTPATKAEEGHDVDISPKEIIEQGIADLTTYQKLEYYTENYLNMAPKKP